MNTIALFALYNNSSIFVYISTAVCTFVVLNQIVIANPPPPPRHPTSGPGWWEGGGSNLCTHKSWAKPLPVHCSSVGSSYIR